MDNEIVITVKSDDDVDSGFDSARRKAEKFKTDVGKIGISAGADAGKGLAGGLTSSLSGLSGSLGPVLVGGAVAAAPLVGAAISGAIIGGVGAGGIVGAFMVAKDDARVAKATDELGNRLQKRLQSAVGPFVSTALGGIDRIDAALGTVNFEKIFGNASRDAGPLFEGIADAVESIGDGFEDLSDGAGPVIREIGEGVSGLGDAIEDGLSSLADNGEEGASALEFLFAVVETGIDQTFNLINALTELWGVIDQTETLTELIGWFADLGDEQETTAGTTAGLTTSSDGLASSFMNQKSALEDLNDAYRAQIDPAFAFIDALDGLEEAERAYNEAVKENGENSEEAEDALRDWAVAAGKANEAAGGAAAGLDGGLTPAMKQLLRNAGFSEEKISDLEQQLKDAKRAADAWEGTYTQTYHIYRTSSGMALGSTNYGSASGSASNRAMGGVVGAAMGGIQNGLRWVGEQGPELVDLPASATVHTAADSQRMMRQAYDGGGGGPVEVILSARPSGGRDLIDALVESLQYECRTNYGGSAQSMIGQPGVLV